MILISIVYSQVLIYNTKKKHNIGFLKHWFNVSILPVILISSGAFNQSNATTRSKLLPETTQKNRSILPLKNDDRHNTFFFQHLSP